MSLVAVTSETPRFHIGQGQENNRVRDLAERQVSISELHIVWLVDMIVVADLQKSVAFLYQQVSSSV